MTTKRIGTTAQGFERFDDGASVQNVETTYVDTEGNGTYAKTAANRLYVWSASILDWIRWDGSVTGGGGGGGGGAVTVADGADVAQGTTTDTSSTNTVIGLLKAIKAALAGTLTVAGNIGRSWTLSSGTDSVNVGNFPATQPVSAAALPLPAGAATETTLAAANTSLGTDGAAPPAIAGTGVRGWLRAIYEKLTGSIAVTGTFWQATQPVSLATNTPDVTDRSGRLLGHVTVDSAPTTAVTVASLPTHGVTVADGSDAAQGTTTDLSSANTVIGLLKAVKAALTGTLAVSGTFFQATQPVSLATNTPDVTDRSARLLGHVTVDNASIAVTAASLPTHGVTVADGADIAQGSTADLSSANTVVGILKAIKAAVTGTLAVSGTFWQATQPVSLATNTPDVTDRAGRLVGVVSGGANVFHIDDNAGSVTVDAPVGTPLFVRISDGIAALIGQKAAAGGIPVTLASDQTVVDNAGFTDGTTPLIMTGYVFDETAGTALTENDAAAARVDAKRATVGVLEDGTTRGTRATVKASGVAPLATDTALVVVPRLTPSEGTAFASASRAAGTYTFDIADTTGFSGIAIITDLTVLGASSTVTNSIQVKDPVTAKFATATAAAFTAVNAVSTTRQAMHPANAGATGNLQGGVMTKAIRVNVVVATAASTFSVGYSLTP